MRSPRTQSTVLNINIGIDNRDIVAFCVFFLNSNFILLSLFEKENPFDVDRVEMGKWFDWKPSNIALVWLRFVNEL